MEKTSSCNGTIPKPYFVIHVPFEDVVVLLGYNYVAQKWIWMQKAFQNRYIGVSIEGLIYEDPFFTSGTNYSISILN